jgi:long-chain acyl-CoA synthetase
MNRMPQALPAWPNTVAMMLRLASEWPLRPMLRGYRDGAWVGVTWADFARQVASLARHLRHAGISAGDRVLLVSENRPEFLIAEVALQAIRAVPVPAYTTNTVADHAHILSDSGARAAIVSQSGLAAKVTQAGGLDLVVCMEPGFASVGVRVLDWGDLVGDATEPADILAEAETISPGTLAVIIYTSGTGGAPKGVMLSHRAIMANCRSAYQLIRPLGFEDEVYLSFLPLSHAYEHTVGGFFLPTTGTEIVYARGIEHLAADMASVRPTIMTMVPRILDVIRTRILLQAQRQPKWKQRLLHLAVAVGRRRAEGTWSLVDRLFDPLLEQVVRQKVRAGFGGRLRAMMSGGARLEPEVGRFFQGLGLVMMQGYGQTEAGPVISAVAPDSTRLDTVGRPLVDVECRIAEDGEICVRGELVMEGYWGRPDDTALTIRDGWLHTGDIGRLDPDGALVITDRKRDMIVLSGGDNISPARIEGMLVAEAAIAQAVVAGEGKAGIAALLVAAEGSDAAAVAAAVAAVNARLSVTERVRKHTLVAPFSLDNGLLTATQKVRRQLVMKAHHAELERMLG